MFRGNPYPSMAFMFRGNTVLCWEWQSWSALRDPCSSTMPSTLPPMSPMFHGNPVVRCSEWQPWYPLCDPCSFPSPLGTRTVLVPISVLVPMPGEMALLQPSVYGRQSQLRHINTTYRSHTHRFQTTIHIQNTHVYTYIRIFVGFVGVGLGCVGLIGVELDDVGFGAVGLIDLCWDGFVRVGLDEVGVGVAVQGGTLEWHPEEGASRSGLGEVLQLEAKSPSVGGIKSFSWRQKVPGWATSNTNQLNL